MKHAAHVAPWLALLVVVCASLWARRDAMNILQSHESLSEFINAKYLDTHYGVVIVNGEGKVLVWNPAMEQITGYTTAEVKAKGFDIDRLVPAESRAAHHKWFVDAFLTGNLVGKVVHNEGHIIGKDGKPVRVVIALRMLRTVTDGLVAKLNVDRIENVISFKSLEKKDD